MVDLEAAADLATGAVLARAVEPKAGETADGHTNEKNCLNCGSPLQGAFCHACGQQAHVHRTLAAFWHDLAHGVLHFDGKIWRTLPLLAWRPGELTRRYIHGERATFVSPVALFLFTVFLMFAIFSVVGVGVDAAEFRNTSADVRGGLKDQRQELVELRQARAEAMRKGNGVKVGEADADIRETEQAIAALNAFIEAKPGRSEVVVGRTGWQRIDAGVKKLNENPALAFYKLQSNAYKFSWALIPISVPFVWLLFLHRRRYRQYGTYDHVIFVTYSITFMSMALIAAVLAAQLPATAWLRWAIVIVPPVHMYQQLRGAYELSPWSALWRTVALLIIAIVAVTLFMLLLAALGVAG
jgi:hypothetical protein